MNEYIYSLLKLRVLTLHISVGCSEKVRFHLPPHLDKCEFKSDKFPPLHLHLTNIDNSLKYLAVSGMTTLDLDLSALKVLVWKYITFDYGPTQLIDYLSKCSALKTLKLTIEGEHKASFVQALIDSLSKLTLLQNLILTADPWCRYEVETITFEQEKFPSLKKLYIALHHRIVFDCMNSFHTFTAMRNSLHFEGNNMDFYARGEGFSYSFEENSDKLTKVIISLEGHAKPRMNWNESSIEQVFSSWPNLKYFYYEDVIHHASMATFLKKLDSLENLIHSCRAEVLLKHFWHKHVAVKLVGERVQLRTSQNNNSPSRIL